MRMDIGALRAQTPGCAGRIHLNNAGAALMSQPTLDAMTGQLLREAQIGGYEAAADDEIDRATEVVAGLARLPAPPRTGPRMTPTRVLITRRASRSGIRTTRVPRVTMLVMRAPEHRRRRAR
jgi:hypothetical protein